MNKRLYVVAIIATTVIALWIGCAAPSTCTELAPHIIDLSEENESAFRPRILKLYNIRSINNTNRLLECRADAKTSHGEDASIIFYMEDDDDGDRFIGYRQG